MKTSTKGIHLIKHFEGVFAKPYVCPAGFWTIGCGHLITPAQAEQYKDGITTEQIDDLLKLDLVVAERAVHRSIGNNLSQGEFDALVSFSFNLGGGALHSSSLRRKLLRGDRLGAANEFPKWCFAGGRKLLGLQRRRLAERQLFLSGEVSPTP